MEVDRVRGRKEEGGGAQEGDTQEQSLLVVRGEDNKEKRRERLVTCACYLSVKPAIIIIMTRSVGNDLKGYACSPLLLLHSLPIMLIPLHTFLLSPSFSLLPSIHSPILFQYNSNMGRHVALQHHLPDDPRQDKKDEEVGTQAWHP